MARVTVLASDKTGTLTTGAVKLERVETLNGDGVGPMRRRIEHALAAVAASDKFPNATMKAIQVAHPDDPGWPVVGRISFDSAHKYSAVQFDGGVWYVGAPEILLPPEHAAVQRVDELAAEGHRVLLLAEAATMPAAGVLPDDLSAVALVLFTDEVRPDAAETIDYFLRENVRPKVISGDNPITVSAIARRCNVPDADHHIDARELPDEPTALADVAQANAVFGRVTPEAKRALFHALQSRGEVVAMTGDGVNDTLALKDADLGIAMGAGTPAAKAVSELVLLDNRFATLPSVVAEGRRVIANIERVARLFLTKTVWAAVLAVLTGVLLTPVPAAPAAPHGRRRADHRHPRVRALVPAQPRPRPSRLHPSGAAVLDTRRSDHRGGDDVGVRARQRAARRPIEQAQSGATMTLVAIGLWVLYELACPIDAVRLVLILGLVVMAVGAFTIPFVAEFFLLEIPSADYAPFIVAIVAAACVLIRLALRVVGARPTSDDPPGTRDASTADPVRAEHH